MHQPDLFDQTPKAAAMVRAQLAGERGIAMVQEKAERTFPDFTTRAAAFVLQYLQAQNIAPAEDITDACKAAGIVPHDDRAFGAVYKRLANSRKILKAGTCKRRRGHATTGGNLWQIAP